MTKKITFTILLIFVLCTIGLAQDQFVYDQTGLNPKYIVVEIDSMNKDELFSKTINWIKETYKNPDEVIKTTIDNEKVRFEGFKDNLICVNSLGMIYCYNSFYTIEIEFKDSKFKFTPLNLEYRVPASQYNKSMMIPINFNDGSDYYNKKNNLKKMNETIPTSISGLFNELNDDLKRYLVTTQQKKDKDDW